MSASTTSLRPYGPTAALPDELPVRLAAGIELLGRYQGSGSIDAPYLLRRADGRVFEVSSLLYLIASAIDGRRTLGEVGVSVSVGGGRPISAHQVSYLVEHKLGPLGVIAGADQPPTAATRRPLLGLTLARAVVPPPAVEAATRVLSPLFRLPVVVVVLSAVVAFDLWLLSRGGIGGAMHQVLATPALVLAMAAVTVVGGAFHELGHASASRRGGARPGVIGVGIYLLWPVFYNDLNDSYRLSRAARLRVDLGGIYFNAVFIAALAGIYALTEHAALLVAIVLQHFAIVQQLLPFLRLDGYYLVSDIAGVPDLFARVRPVLSRLVGRRSAPAASDLKPAAHLIVTTWVLVLVPLLGAAVVGLVVSLPGLLATAAGTVVVQAGNLMAAFSRGDEVTLTLSLLQLAVYAVPLVGLGVTLARALHRLPALVRSRPAPVVPDSAGPSWFSERSLGLRSFFDTGRGGWIVAGVVAVGLCLATVVLTGGLSMRTSPDETSGPLAAALVGPAPVLPPTTLAPSTITTAPNTTAPITTAPITTAPDTTAADTTAPTAAAPIAAAPDTTAPDTTAPTAAAPITTAPTRTTVAPPTSAPPEPVFRPAPGVDVEPVPAPLPSPGPVDPAVPPGPVTRRQPSSAEVQQAIDGFRPYVRSIVPVSPSPEQVAELGHKICTAFDEGHSVAQIKEAGREMAENVPLVSVREGGDDYILRTAVALYCPGHTPSLE